MTNNTVTIKIENNAKVENVRQTLDENGSIKEETFKKAKGLSNSAFKTGAIMIGQKSASFALSNFANLTGDYRMQEKLNNSLEMATLGAMAVLGGPIGIATAMGSIAMKGINYQIELTKQKQQIEFLRLRVGGYNE